MASEIIIFALFYILIFGAAAPANYYFIANLLSTGKIQNITIPVNVSSIYVELCGGNGGSFTGTCLVFPCTG